MNPKMFIHKSAIVETVTVGEDTTIWAFTHILDGAVIGSNVNICDHCFIENDVVVGDNVTVKCGVYLWDGIIIENNVFIGPNATFTNDKLPRSKNREYKNHKTILMEGCSIGANATILPGITIGKYSMVGAGSVVTKSVPDYALVIGNQAIIKGYVCICGNGLIFSDGSATCNCGEKYELINDIVKRI